MTEIIFGTGFEYGSILPFVQSGGSEFPQIQASGYTGDWRVEIRGGGSAGWLDMPDITGSVNDDELYFACAVHPHDTWGTANNMRFYVYDGDGNNFGFFLNSGAKMDAYVGAGLIEAGDTQLVNGWNSFQFYIKIANSGGRIITKLDGIVDIDYTGDTLQGSTPTFDRVRFYGTGSDWLIDDIAYGSEDWIGAIRFEPLRPNGDDTLEWASTPTGTHYTTVDDTSPGTADYITTTGTAEVDKFDTEDFPETSKIPLIVMQWAYASKAAADDTKLEFILDDGTEAIAQPQELTVANGYLSWRWATPPSGGSWTDALLDALIHGYRSELP